MLAAPAKHPLPDQQIRVMLAASKKAGVPFDRAWASAYSRVSWPHDTTHRREWKDTLECAMTVWRSAYEDSTSCRYENMVTGMALEAA